VEDLLANSPPRNELGSPESFARPVTAEVMNGFAVSSGVAAVGTAGAVREEPLQSPVLARQRRPHL